MEKLGYVEPYRRRVSTRTQVLGVCIFEAKKIPHRLIDQNVESFFDDGLQG